MFLSVFICVHPWLQLPAAAGVETIEHPFLGVTHITRTDTSPRNMNIHIVKIDLTAPGISFKLTPHSGTRDTVRETTLAYLNQQLAQVAVNINFFLPFPSSDLNADLIGFAASNGSVFSPFELPSQNYAIVRDAPGLNIDPKNHASIVTRDPNFSDGQCYFCATNDGLHVRESVTLWNTVTGSAQIVTDGVKTIPCYVDTTHSACQLVGPGPANYSNSNSWYDRINARTSIGVSQDGKTLVLFTVDAAGGSAGMKVGEVADMLINDYGVYNALNLDGGGSTTLAMENPVTHVRTIVNRSSDNMNGRAVGSNLAVFASPNVAALAQNARAKSALE